MTTQVASRQSTPSSTLEVKLSDQLLAIGQLARHARYLGEFRLMTYWDSIDAVREFAGETTTEAVLFPGARRSS